jgi:16S rRNA (uracil1498-N3)-methyltransferase
VTRFASRYPAAAHTFAAELGDHVTLDGAAGHHLGRVRRLRAGEVVTVADGGGRWRPYTIVDARRGTIELDAHGEPEAEPPLVPGLTVAFALTKGAKPELAVQKLTELGVDRIAPLLTQRSVRRWGNERASAAVERLGRVAAEAAAQCRRARLPDVEPPQPLAELLGHPGLVVADPSGDEVDEIDAPPDGEWVLAVGPEGGFEADELAGIGRRARLRLGPHLLRAETAAIAGAAILTTRRVPDLSALS